MADRARYLSIQDVEHKAGPFYFNWDEFGADTLAAPHSHSWGHLNYTAHGTMQMEAEGLRFLSPPQYAVWIPPRVVHSCTLRHAVVYRTVYIVPALCAELPTQPCTVRISPIIRSVLADFAARDVNEPVTPADLRLAQVVVDQLARAEVLRCYLPAAASPALVGVLEALQADPGDHRSLAEWAASVHMTERTLARQCQRELGMSFGDWRQRLRFLRAIDALEAGRTVQEIAFDLGYSTASAFIAMFQREAGTTPEQYRREFCGIAG
ncbi:helix-turn-helix transcriptional regulator [Variovorax sp.]|uniref:AraC family transcriptional regulator n=1 Tax=Variovorax sp. TaxID=1871043 RepID=UPI0013842348|nr:helix-turn-helix transcriptional regulator [Variovorax sp.]KAF1072239.1 MAG: HTH-type transcriptional regulator NimR [Variovorax sp.]